MHEEALREAGLSLNEAKVYGALLRLKEAGVEMLAVKSGVHRRNVYDCIAKLIEKGLLSEIFIEKKKYYRAINPSRLLDLLGEKETAVRNAMPELEKEFARIDEGERAYIYRGISGFRNYMQDILEVGEPVYFIGAKGGWFDPRLRLFCLNFLKKAKTKKIQYYHLFDWEMQSEMPEVMKSVGKPYKFLPKGYSTSAAIDVFGDRVVTFTGLGVGRLDDQLTQFVIVSRRLADSYRTWFQYMWDQCPEP